jgi:hydroxyacid-oxoacid transhydrogenase
MIQPFINCLPQRGPHWPCRFLFILNWFYNHSFCCILVFQFTAPSSPDRHREALAIFNSTTATDPSITSIPDREIGAHLYETIARFLDNLGVPRGLKAIGYNSSDVAMLVKGTLPQRRVLDLAPGIGDVAGEDGTEHLTRIIEGSMQY